MKPFETEEITDGELSRLLATWTVTVPTDKLRARIFSERHPAFLLTSEVERPWYKALFHAARQNRSFGAALAFQICAVAFCFVAIGPPVVRQIAKQTETIFLAPYRTKLPMAAQKAGGGGGGGQHSLAPVARGEAPKLAAKPFIPPAMAVPNPVLPVVPTISAAAPQIDAANYGDPLTTFTGVSPGQGVNGLGDGKNGGLGKGDGTGYGPGKGGNIGDGVYSPGGDVSTPVLVLKVEPEYSDEARRAKLSGTVLLSIVVDVNGIPRDFHVVRALGLGLDEKAIEAVQRWRFKPGMRHGRVVAVQAQVEVSFRLL